MSNINFLNSKRGQVTIFIIIAIVIVAVAGGIFVFRDELFGTNLPAEVGVVEESFLECLRENTQTGLDILGSQGGYIYVDELEFEGANKRNPFSSQLNFLGNTIPYWFYYSASGLENEQIPTEDEMEDELERYLEEELISCNFKDYYDQGYEINPEFEEARVDVRIAGGETNVLVNMPLTISKGETRGLIEKHEIEVESNLGSLYNTAKEVYLKEQEELFLENYAIDTLRLYAPVDGVEISCSPEVWKADEVFETLGEAIETNTLALRGDDNEFILNEKESEYFVIDLPNENNQEVRFLNFRDWPYYYEVVPSEGILLIAEPVGNQPGLGILGFCYVPYHFVYNVKYPVLVQVSDSISGETFQFPIAVSIEGNRPRKPLEGSEAISMDLPELCEQKNTEINVNVYDVNLNSVDAEISYECFGTTCDLGETENGNLQTIAPQCVNGKIIARAEGYDEGSQTIQSLNGGENVEIFLDKIYEKEIELNLEGKNFARGEAIISFNSEKFSRTIIYPEQKTIELTEGDYDVTVYGYSNSSIQLQSESYEQCVEVPREGLGGFFGMEEEKCFDIELPSQFISTALVGGGSQNYYVLESELRNSQKIIINAEELPTPRSLEQLQINYEIFDRSKLFINFV